MTLQPGDRAVLTGRIEDRFIPPDDHYRVFIVDGDDEPPLLTELHILWAAVQPGPHRCNCTAKTDNTDREIDMTIHPARPQGYRPFTTCGEITAELVDIDAITRDVFGPDVPLRDRVATLVADWQDSTVLLDDMDPDTVDRQAARRGLA